MSQTATVEVRVQPKARRNAIDVLPTGGIRVAVTAPPDRGQANDAVVRLLARGLHVPKSAVRIVRGGRTRYKLIEVEGVEKDELVRRLS